GVYRAPVELFAAMPRDAYPKGWNGLPERKVANEWVKKNLVGKTIEWKAKLSVGLADKGELYTVYCQTDAPHPWASQSAGGRSSAQVWGDPITIGGETCFVCHEAMESRGGSDYALCYDRVDDATARKLREFDGRTVVLRATIKEASFEFGSVYKDI